MLNNAWPFNNLKPSKFDSVIAVCHSAVGLPLTLMICSSAMACSCLTVPAGTDAVSVVTVGVVAMHVLMPGSGTGAATITGVSQTSPVSYL